MKMCQTLSAALLALVMSTPSFVYAEKTPQPTAQEQTTTAVNIDTATVEDLMAIKGIGAKKAQAIVDYRNQNGPYASVDDLTNVRGIGPNQVNAWRSLLTVG